jgi:hypothetical protein
MASLFCIRDIDLGFEFDLRVKYVFDLEISGGWPLEPPKFRGYITEN